MLAAKTTATGADLHAQACCRATARRKAVEDVIRQEWAFTLRRLNARVSLGFCFWHAELGARSLVRLYPGCASILIMACGYNLDEIRAEMGRAVVKVEALLAEQAAPLDTRARDESTRAGYVGRRPTDGR